jgi:purine-binding chemotaxis protein CheW
MELNMVEEKETSRDFLAFYLNAKNYAFPILKVNEVIVLPEITPIPKAPAYMKGIINLRGQIIPIIDLRLALNMDRAEYDKQTCVIIVKMQVEGIEKMVGFIVDCVSEVFEIDKSNIEAPPNYGEKLDDGFLIGIGKVKEKIVMLLDIDKILSDSKMEEILKDDFDKNVAV